MVGKVDLILPEELYDLIWEKVKNRLENVQYSKVIMPPLALLEGGFFNSYIKSGSFIVLSRVMFYIWKRNIL